MTNTIIRYVLKASGTFGMGGFKTTDAGAATTVVAALDPALSPLKGVSAFLLTLDFMILTCPLGIEGLYLSDCQFGEPASHASSLEAAQKLWALSEKLVGENFNL
jgi:hypothetical protein